MEYKISEYEIYLLSAGDVVGAEGEDDYYILYAPISQDICFLEKTDAIAIKSYLENDTPINDELREFAQELTIANRPPKLPSSPRPELTTHMSIMPNYKCNFSCVYCYSARGRSSHEIEWNQVQVALEYFIDKQRIPPQQLSLFISGGGEPLLSWETVSRAISFARERASDQGFPLRISVVTNGSLITQKHAQWLKQNDCTVCISFEVLDFLQNNQRGHFDRIVHSLDLLREHGVRTMINSTITPISVNHMVEMTREVIRRYPFVSQFTMEPVTSVDLFPTSQDLRHFYEVFSSQYEEASRLAKEHGLKLRFEMDEALEQTVIRHCPGKFCLTASGTISACHLATSPNEKRYSKCVYGRIEEGRLMIDNDRFLSVYSQNMLNREECEKCFARWNCGGECMARRDMYPDDYMYEVCRFNKRWIKHLLTQKIEQEVQESRGMTLSEVALEDDIEALKKHNIFILPTDGNQWLLYAPLADSAALFSFDEVRRLSKVAAGCAEDQDAAEVFTDLCDVVPFAERPGYVRSANDFINLSILPNNVCNFTCSYCYSARGRSNERLDLENAKSMVDYFFSPDRNNSPLLTVSIYGGGEPLLSWQDVVRPLIDYTYCKAVNFHRRVKTMLITNGSILPPDFLSTCKEYGIQVVVSYEILKDVQDVQRRHFNLVSDNIQQMIDAGIVPAVNSVITMMNVERMLEMVDALHERYPQINNLSVEPVIDEQMKNKAKFYSLFINNFMKAYQYARGLGITLSCSASRKVDQTLERYCAGELALCADGSLSICPCVSSPKEPHFDDYVFGHVDGARVFVDHQRLSQLLAVNGDSYTWCQDCFARWNCAGGCMHSNVKNHGQQDMEFCDFTRELTKRLIIERLNNAN